MIKDRRSTLKNIKVYETLIIGEIDMVLIFILMFIAVLFAWRGHRRKAIYCLAVTLTVALLFFYHDITVNLNIEL